MMCMDALDHLVLTVRNINRTCDFYSRLLGMEIIEFSEGRKALAFGRQKINLHQAGKEYEPHALQPVPGSADLCFLTSVPLDAFLGHCRRNEVEILRGPVARTGAAGPIVSVYLRDPDGNLLEVANLLAGDIQEEKA